MRLWAIGYTRFPLFQFAIILNSRVKPTHTYRRMISTSPNGLKIRRNWQKNVDKSLLLLIRKHKFTVGFPFDVGALKVLEPYAGKLARTVLRGRKLPGLRHEVAELIVLQRHKVFDRTCCSPNSTLPGQLMYGEAIIGWSSWENVPKTWIVNPHSQAESREVDSLRGLNTDIGHGSVSMAKLIEHSSTTVSMEGAKKRMIRSEPKGWADKL